VFKSESGKVEATVSCVGRTLSSGISAGTILDCFSIATSNFEATGSEG